VSYADSEYVLYVG